MEEEYEIIYSPLCREFKSEGHTVKVLIYRGATEEGWTLEVEDIWDNSTVWDDLFETDEQALEAFVQAIEKEGIRSVSGPVS